VTPELESQVLSAVRACPSGGCALDRLAHVNNLRGTAMLSQVAMRLGMTQFEAYGVMDGWDSGELGLGGCFEQEVSHMEGTDPRRVQYDVGFALGVVAHWEATHV
jgi:hypothetical protein